MLNWISQNIYHDGGYDGHVKDTAMDLFDFAFGKGEDYGLNCRSLSLALTECLHAIGIKARTVYMMPYSPYDMDNHVVCEAWISELDKWIMLDPTYNLYASFNNTILNILELRRLIADQEAVIYSESANYNGSPINADEITTYYAKDLFRFCLSDIQGQNSSNIEGQRFINIAPYGYDVKKFDLVNLDFRAKKWGNNVYLETRRKKMAEDGIIYKDFSVLY